MPAAGCGLARYHCVAPRLLRVNSVRRCLYLVFFQDEYPTCNLLILVFPIVDSAGCAMSCRSLSLVLAAGLSTAPAEATTDLAGFQLTWWSRSVPSVTSARNNVCPAVYWPLLWRCARDEVHAKAPPLWLAGCRIFRARPRGRTVPGTRRRTAARCRFRLLCVLSSDGLDRATNAHSPWADADDRDADRQARVQGQAHRCGQAQRWPW